MPNKELGVLGRGYLGVEEFEALRPVDDTLVSLSPTRLPFSWPASLASLSRCIGQKVKSDNVDRRRTLSRSLPTLKVRLKRTLRSTGSRAPFLLSACLVSTFSVSVWILGENMLTSGTSLATFPSLATSWTEESGRLPTKLPGETNGGALGRKLLEVSSWHCLGTWLTKDALSKSLRCWVSFLLIKLPGGPGCKLSSPSSYIERLVEETGQGLDDPKLVVLLSLKLILPGTRLKRDRNRLEGFKDWFEEECVELLPVLDAVWRHSSRSTLEGTSSDLSGFTFLKESVFPSSESISLPLVYVTSSPFTLFWSQT